MRKGYPHMYTLSRSFTTIKKMLFDQQWPYGYHNETLSKKLNTYTVTAKIYFHLMNFFLF
jgi:hypothetical protein